MISTCRNDFTAWSFQEQIDVRNQYLSGECLEMIGRDCHRHAKNVCLELIRQGVLDERDDISRGHIRFERREYASDTDSESEEEIDGESDEDYVYESESESDGESDYESESESEGETDVESDYESEDESVEVIVKNDIHKQIDSIYAILGNLQRCVLSLLK
jgi:hypothetical protein